MEVSRADYIALLYAKRENGRVKMITGVGKCGKSYLLLTLFRRHLLEKNIPEDHIISLALDDSANNKYLDAKELYDYIAGQIKENEHYYILLDEIHLVKGFEDVLNNLMHLPGADIYITGSSSEILSRDIITDYNANGDEIRVYPFSFAEFYSVVGGDKQEALDMYCRYGGIPQVLQMQTSEEKENFLKSLFDQVYFRDVVINSDDMPIENEIGKIANIIASSIGTSTSTPKIFRTLVPASKKMDLSYRVDSYIDYLKDICLINAVRRYDIICHKYKYTPQFKYYFVDMGLRNACLNFSQQGESGIMENVIYNELLRRRFSVDSGELNLYTKLKHPRIKLLKIDFMAYNGSSHYYIQAALELDTPEKIRQEEEPFLKIIKDPYKKIIIQKSSVTPWHDERGVLIIGLMDFLLHPECLEW